MKKAFSPELLERMKEFQRAEITEYHIYKRLAERTKNQENQEVLEKIADDELEHYKFWHQLTETHVQPNKWLISKFYWLARFLGLTFAIKLLEQGEEKAQEKYRDVSEEVPEVKKLIEEEDFHEKQLIDMIEEEHLKYVGSIVLGLNDALVELTGALAGFTFAMQDNMLIAMAGMITGVSASLSMATSEYLSQKTEGSSRALKSALYTGSAYIITVALLIIPYFLLENHFASLGMVIFTAVLIIFLFNYYISVARDYSFKRRFLEMASISLGVAALSFGIGYLIRIGLGIDM